ncbi:hypothetical protein Psta_1885 [Pirellula staleyi DSM 6068]|uniref:Uncharacterized protein n=1 Tax=Pirellula staleyi (strain ATCC 27377 / DSM 6068 / ICPB 4128) TaxID=530564 RepID=D2QZS6_PIRSD|nr:hypothetical protein Psta_1885 [Pirellula staleyi DSM 6068]
MAYHTHGVRLQVAAHEKTATSLRARGGLGFIKIQWIAWRSTLVFQAGETGPTFIH